MRPGRRQSESLSFLRSVAFHEAGHIAISRLLGLPVAGATVRYIDGHFGCTWATEGDEPVETVGDLCDTLLPLLPSIGDDRSDVAVELLRLHHQVIALLAGPISEELLIGARLPGSEHDDHEAACMGRLICRSSASLDAYLEFARCEARALLNDHSLVALAVAEALFRLRTLDGRQIDAVIGAAIRSPTSA